MLERPFVDIPAAWEVLEKYNAVHKLMNQALMNELHKSFVKAFSILNPYIAINEIVEVNNILTKHDIYIDDIPGLSSVVALHIYSGNYPELVMEFKAKELYKPRHNVEDSQFKFIEKFHGTFIGYILNINFPSYTMKYYIKMHSYGCRLDCFDKPPKPVDLQEVYAYKLLSLLNYCTEIDFLFEDETSFFISSLDAGFDVATQTNKFTCKYSDLKKYYEEKGCDFTDFFADYSTLAPSFLIEMIRQIDLICKLLNICDILNHMDNVVFIGEDIEHITDFKIVDLLIPRKRCYKNYPHQNYQENDCKFLAMYEDSLIGWTCNVCISDPSLKSYRRRFDFELFTSKAIETFEYVKSLKLTNCNLSELSEYHSNVLFAINDLNNYMQTVEEPSVHN